jgi:hypothetical protein
VVTLRRKDLLSLDDEHVRGSGITSSSPRAAEECVETLLSFILV